MSAPTTRFRTALAADCCANSVTLPFGIEKPCQWMMALGELVTLRLLVPRPWNCAAPFTTCGPVGLAQAVANPKQPLTATAIGRSSHRVLFNRPPLGALTRATGA